MWPVTQRESARRPAPHRQYLPMPPLPRARPGLYEGEPEACRRDFWQFVPILAHLGLLLAVFKVFRIEGRAFPMLVTTALVALPVHYVLPYRWKKPMFVAVSVSGLALVFGTVTAAWVLALSAALIGICLLPLPWWPRAAAMAAAAVAVALARTQGFAASVPET